MAKRNRARPLREGASDGSTQRTARPRRRTTVRSERGPLDRYRTPLIAGVAVIGLLIIGLVFFQGATRAAYECRTLLTPGPVETPRTPRPATPSPSPALSPAASPDASPAASPGASPDGTPAGSPGASPAASPDASPEGSPAASPGPSPAASPAGSPTAGPSPTASPTPAPDPTARLGFPTGEMGRQHVPPGQSITYDYCPPASGPHHQVTGVAPMPPAVYQPGQERMPGNWVHNLEHGYVAVLYRCPSGQLGMGDCITREELNQLEAFHAQAPAPQFSACPNKTLVARFDSMTTRFAYVAWDRVLLVDDFSLDDALIFAEQWMEQDPVVLPERQAC